MTLQSKNIGFSLIEVLVAVFVFATGILGLASLQMNGLKILSNSHSISSAMLAANDMADRMRANPVALFDGYYDAITGSETNPECGSDCSAAQIAQYDAYSVASYIDEQLPEPTLSVANTGNNVFTIEVTWTERLGIITETKVHRVSFVPYKP